MDEDETLTDQEVDCIKGCVEWLTMTPHHSHHRCHHRHHHRHHCHRHNFHHHHHPHYRCCHSCCHRCCHRHRNRRRHHRNNFHHHHHGRCKVKEKKIGNNQEFSFLQRSLERRADQRLGSGVLQQIAIQLNAN